MADAATLTSAFMRSHPADAARVLEAAPTPASVDLLARVAARIGSAVLAEMLPRSAAELLLAMPEERAFELLAHIDAQRGAAMLRQLDLAERARLLAGLPTTLALTAKLLLEYIDDAVGACMNPDIVALPGKARVEVSLDRVRNSHTAIERIYIVDDDRHLLGWVPLSTLLRMPASAMLETLRLPAPERVAARAPLSGARVHPGWKSAAALPVVDRQGRLLGEITRDALERASRQARTVRPEEGSLGAVLVHGYWQSISGILELLLPMLPASRPIWPRRDER